MVKDAKENYRKKLRKAYEKLEKAYRELWDSHVEMIFRLALMAEYRDLATGTHLVRIAEYSAIIAEAFGLPKREVEIIRYSSPMHDAGKIALPDTILKKKGKLTSEEIKLVREHPAIGAEIFKSARSTIMRACGIIALTHHERFDGAGYPQGLKGKEIPLYGRIVGLADVFEAFTAKRSYKKAYGFDRSASMVIERAGSHFDPDVVMAFVRSRDRIKKVWEANRDIEEFLEGVEGSSVT